MGKNKTAVMLQYYEALVLISQQMCFHYGILVGGKGVKVSQQTLAPR